MDKIKGFMASQDEDELELDEEELRLSEYETTANKGFTKVAADTKMVLFEPRSFDEAEDIAKHLKDKRAAVINLHRLNREYAQRTIDFLTGVVFGEFRTS